MPANAFAFCKLVIKILQVGEDPEVGEREITMVMQGGLSFIFIPN